MNKLALFAVLPLSLGACLDMGDESSVDQSATGDNGLTGAPEHIQLQKGEAHSSGTSSALMTNHGGTVLTASKTEAIFWGAWSSGDEHVTGMDSLFSGWSGSTIARASTEYSGTNGQVTANSSYLGHTFDPSSPPRKALSTRSAVAEACKITNDSPDPAAVYFIYTSTGAGHVNYCAWHSWGTCSNGNPIQVAYMPNIDGIAGCDPGDTSGLHSEGVAALANVTSHELSEAVTDPRGATWYDSSGAEIGDKCAWAFNGLVTVGSSKWLLQGEWSNNAYNNGTGVQNLSGQPGCLY